MDAPANTVSYFIAGYVVIFSIMIVYLNHPHRPLAQPGPG